MNETVRKFEELYNSNFGRLKVYAAEFVAAEEAENIVQDAFIQLFIRLDSLPKDTDLLSYMFVATKHSCLNHVRRAAVMGKHNDIIKNHLESEIGISGSETSGSGEVSWEDMEAAMADIISSLPHRCREIFLKNKIQGLTQKEIAAEMNISVKTVEAQIRIARKKLKDTLTDLF